jgi:hypothetical protein
MRLKTAFCAAAMSGLCALGSPALAGPATDTLGTCLITSAGKADPSVLSQWMYVAMGTNPALGGLSSVTADQKQAINAKAAAFIQKAMLTDCRPQALDALRADGPSSIEKSFQLLGAVAARQLVSDPATLASLQGVARGLDPKTWEAFAAEAGTAEPAASAPVKPAH